VTKHDIHIYWSAVFRGTGTIPKVRYSESLWCRYMLQC